MDSLVTRIKHSAVENTQYAVGYSLLGIFFGAHHIAGSIDNAIRHVSDKIEYYRTQGYVNSCLDSGIINPTRALYGFRNAAETIEFTGGVQTFYLPPNKKALLEEIADSKDRKELMEAIHKMNDPFTYYLQRGDPINHYHVVVLERIGEPRHLRFHVSERLGPEDFCIDVIFGKHAQRIVNSGSKQSADLK